MTAGSMIAGADANAARNLLFLLCCWFEPKCGEALGRTVDWSGLLRLAHKTKVAGLLSHAIKAGNIVVPDAVAQELARMQASILQAGLFNLAWTIKVSKTLNKAGIDAVAFKGAINAQAVYGTWDKRRSSDIDILVRKPDYRRAISALEADGYISVFCSASKWWHEYLGESPLQRHDVRDVIVDLHYQVQQPGGPYPAAMDQLLLSAQAKTFGAEQINVISKEHSAVIAAICYGKAVRAGAPWIHHAHEMLVLHRNASAAEQDRIRSAADFHHLRRLYDEALGNSQKLFEGAVASVNAGSNSQVTDELLFSSIGLVKNPHFFRSRKLWNWLDGGIVTRSYLFASGLARVIRSEMVQRSEERIGLIPSSLNEPSDQKF